MLKIRFISWTTKLKSSFILTPIAPFKQSTAVQGNNQLAQSKLWPSRFHDINQNIFLVMDIKVIIIFIIFIPNVCEKITSSECFSRIQLELHHSHLFNQSHCKISNVFHPSEEFADCNDRNFCPGERVLVPPLWEPWFERNCTVVILGWECTLTAVESVTAVRRGFTDVLISLL